MSTSVAKEKDSSLEALRAKRCHAQEELARHTEEAHQKERAIADLQRNLADAVRNAAEAMAEYDRCLTRITQLPPVTATSPDAVWQRHDMEDVAFLHEHLAHTVQGLGYKVRNIMGQINYENGKLMDMRVRILAAGKNVEKVNKTIREKEAEVDAAGQILRC